MANEPQRRRSWDKEHQSSSSQIFPPANNKLGLVTTDSMPLLSPASPVPSAVSRRLPPPHASLGPLTEAGQTSPSKLASTLSRSQSRLHNSPNLTWQHGATTSSTKRRRVQPAEHAKEDSHTSHAYSSTLSHDGRLFHAQSGPVPQPGDSRALYDNLSGDGGHAPGPAQVAEILNTVDRRPSIASVGLASTLTRCCSPHCNGSRCETLRTLLATILSEFQELDHRLQGAIAGTTVQLAQQPPDVEPSNLHHSLAWLLDRVRWNNAGIRSLLDPTAQAAQSQEGQLQGGIPPQAGTIEGQSDSDPPPYTRATSPDTMKRRRGEVHKEAPPPRRLAPSLQPTPESAPAPFATGPMAGPSRQLPPVGPSGEQPSTSYSPHSSYPTSQQSPLHTPQQHAAQTGRVLPSPSSFQYGAPQQPHLPATTYTTGSSSHHEALPPPSAHFQHLQDLQHQVTVKTLALQTLQGEYDSLLAKLERQRTKCMTLEKKFEVSDVEINSLTEERERLQSQVTLLESHAEELTKGRDDARKEMAESGRQYIRIVEMASRLQVQSSDARRKWDEERKELVDRIRSLELGIADDDNNNDAEPQDHVSEAGAVDSSAKAPAFDSGSAAMDMMQTITPTTSGETMSIGIRAPEDSGPVDPVSITTTAVASPGPRSAPASWTQGAPNPIPALRAEVRRLRSRTQTLEATIRSMIAENTEMQDALRVVTASGRRMRDAMDAAMETEQEA